MRIVLYLSSIALVAIATTWAYRVNYATQEAEDRLEALRVEIAREREAIAMLEAEWAFLNRPDRLRDLVEQHNDVLQLAPLSPEHFGEIDMIAFPPEPEPEAVLETVAGDDAPDAGPTAEPAPAQDPEPLQ